MAKAKRPRRAKMQPRDGVGPNAQTIVYTHGIGNKPTEGILRCQWDNALMDFGLGERSRMAYWCQVDRHGPPRTETCGVPDLIDAQSLGSEGLGARSLRRPQDLVTVIDEIATTSRERASLMKLKDEMLQDRPVGRRHLRGAAIRAEGLEDLDFPDFMTRWVTALFLKDVGDFFFDPGRRQRMKQALRERLATGGGPFVVVAHSQGSMIAYSTLLELGSQVEVPLFLTIGSPLGLGEVRAQMRRLHRLPAQGKLPVPDGVTRWHNLYDRNDVVSQKKALASFYGGADKVIVDGEVRNADRQRDPHSATGYLRLAEVRQSVREAVDLQRFQHVAPFKLAADAVMDFERHPRERRPLLIEVTDPAWARGQHEAALADLPPKEAKAVAARTHIPTTLEAMKTELEKLLHSVRDEGATSDDLDFQALARYVSVRLTRSEAERLGTTARYRELGLPLPPLYRIWRNATKVALLENSIHTVQASAAHQSYQALGAGIHWAVLDSGCSRHPHFNRHNTIVERYDCTGKGNAPVPESSAPPKTGAKFDDQYGHGTHVCGIIAGAYHPPGSNGRVISGIAPLARIHSYRVLDEQGVGEDAWIIKALDHIADLNDRSPGPPVIAGVNLSLGGPFEQGVFGCGHTPLCEELRRLWNQGVLVVIAAGNEGFAELLSSEGELGANLPFTIGDPANLEDAIAVGSIHKEKPFTYGVSHFSSRGPTVDGRSKPDCVAPGEQILSCRHAFPAGATSVRDLYIKLGGTSMAAPHVSGLLACFLSRRREFLGYPNRVKQILLESCTDLKRHRQLQGAGMPNLVRMLVQT